MARLKINEKDYNRLSGLVMSNPFATGRLFITSMQDNGFSNTRIIWEIFWNTVRRAEGEDKQFMTHDLYNYLNDDNIENALKLILKDYVY